MKKHTLLALFLFVSFATMAQSISVKSFKPLPMDMTASSLEGKKIDQNGDVAALIKVMTTETDFVFEGGALGIVDTQQRVGEIWVWVPRGLRKITILHQKLGGLRDYRFPVEIESERTYEMVLTTAKVVTTIEEEVRQQYLVFQVTPKDAVLEVDDQLWTLSTEGTARKFVNFGTYTYRVQAPNYYPEAGKVTIDDPLNKKNVIIDLKPNFGWIEVKGNSVQDAAVFIDNAFIGKAPCKSEGLKSGEHTVKIAKDMYAPYTERITVSDNKITTLSPTLTADFAQVTLTVDSEAEIWVNDEKKGTRTWTGNLASGTYRIECRMYGHESTTTAKEITNMMDGETIILPAPKPIYGSLNIESDPDFAKIFVDGNPMGETPNFISQLLIGQHEIKLTKDGYANYTETVTIVKGERKQVLASLIEGTKDEQTFTVNGVSFTMKLVEGGTFQMGATSEQGNAWNNEKPVHSVSLSNYYIGETEVTQALWKAVMEISPSFFKGDNLPVEMVNWNECQEFISKLNQKTGKNFRLPTEAEWEYAARGGRKSKGYKYAGSNTIGNIAWYADNSGGKTHPVKSKSPNELGLYDMSGNAWEWCQDWYGSYSSGSVSHPAGPSTGLRHVLRGGSYNYDVPACRVSHRNSSFSDYRSSDRGFRLVLPQ